MPLRRFVDAGEAGRLMFCLWCEREMLFVHGHYACGNGECPLRGENQFSCCEGAG